MRGLEQLAPADGLTRGHALVQNARNGSSTLTERVPHPRHSATA